MGKTAIEWADMTWNPIAGCQVVSPACKNCYAMNVGYNLEHVKRQTKYRGLTKDTKAGQKLWTGKVIFWPPALNQVTPGQSPKLIFVNSMSDLWHTEVRVDWLKRIFHKMNECENHTFFILTKRPEVMLERQHHVTWTSNIWQGSTIEDVAMAKQRLPLLRECHAGIKFISAEPLLEDIAPIVAKHTWLDWVICGGESGSQRVVRPMNPAWARELRDLCIQQKIAFFFKQWGNYGPSGEWRGHVPKSEALDGLLWHQYPAKGIFDGMSHVEAA